MLQILLILNPPIHCDHDIELVACKRQQFSVFNARPAILRYCANEVRNQRLAKLSRDVLI